MISIDRVYKTVLFFANSDVRGNVKPDDLRLAINTSVEDIVESYFEDLNRALNKQNRGLSGVGLENVPDRIRERMLYFLKEDDLAYTAPKFDLPTDLRYVDAFLYNDTEIEVCKNNREFRLVANLIDTSPSEVYPICLRIGDTIKVAPTTIIDSVSISYLRKHLIANWSFNIISGAEIYNPSANDFQDIDLHPSEEYNIILKTLGYFGVNLKEQDLVAVTNTMQQQDFNQENAV